MAGNRRAYEAAMKRAANLAWDKKWSRAIEEYRRALAEFPQDVTVLTGLGLAYAETRQLEQALAMYRDAARLSPDNPEVIQRVGHMLERLAQWREAAKAYALAGDAYLRLRDSSQAVELWQKAVILDPENLGALWSLAQAYESQGEARKAARQHLTMARVLYRQNHAADAIQHCNAALALEARNAEARDILEALTQGAPLPDGPMARLQPDASGKRTLDSFVVFEDIELKTATLADSERASPADRVREQSLAQLAETMFAEDADPKTMQANVLLAQGADYQTRGLTDKALNAYLKALGMGSDRPATRFNLGLLFREKRDFGHALEHLNHTLTDPDYILGAHFAIGECYHAWGKTTDALRHFLQVLKLIDSQTVAEKWVGALDKRYDLLTQAYLRQDGPETADRLIRSILSFLNSAGWGTKVIETRQQLDSLAGGSILITLAEILREPEGEMATTAINQIQRYLEQNMLFTALEECFWAIRQAPYCLPLHLRAADILIHEGQLEDAVHKYTTIAQTYQVRGQGENAIALYRRALEIAPMDIQVREQLIRMLIQAKTFDQAIEQYIAVADSYYQLAQVNRALEQYTEALKYAPQSDPSRHWEVNVLHRIGDIYVQRVNWRQAIKAYQRIKRVDGEDEKARSYLVDLYFKIGERDQALHELDELLEFHKTRQEARKTLSVLQDAVRSRPEELGLHMRLAKLCIDLHMKKEAIAELDTVGELQLNAGMTQEAIRTVQAIIRLSPEKVEGYQQLLAQLKTQ